jgi:hypothetical protein
MADRNRRYTLAAFALPFFFLAMAGLARANTIVVNTLDSGVTDTFPLCTLEEAVIAANTQAPSGGCPAGTGNSDTIEFIVTGTIFPDNTLVLGNSSEDLLIQGPTFGCTGAGPCGITINGGLGEELFDVEGPDLELANLTLAEGSSEFGGAIFSGGSEIFLFGCTFVENEAFEGGAIFAIDSLLDLVNDTFSGNEADFGGAIFNEDAEILITNDTFSGNEGAAVETDLGESFVNSSIFGNNIPGGNCAGVTDDGYNISDDNTCGFSGTSINNSTTLNLDPTGLNNNGGPTATVALESGSQAIDFVPIASCVQFPDLPVDTDQRLFARPDDGESSCDAGAYESGGVAPITLNMKTERVQIARGSAANTDQVNMGFTFTYNGDPDCDIPTGGDEDALNSGVGAALFGGSCASLPSSGLILYLDPFQVRTVNHKQYGTLFQSFGPETVSARMVALPPPTGACGSWTLNLEVAGLNTPAMGLGGPGSSPFALVISDLFGDEEEIGVAQALTLADITGDATACFDITNVIAGNQIPGGHGVRRGVRK